MIGKAKREDMDMRQKYFERTAILLHNDILAGIQTGCHEMAGISAHLLTRRLLAIFRSCIFAGLVFGTGSFTGLSRGL